MLRVSFSSSIAGLSGRYWLKPNGWGTSAVERADTFNTLTAARDAVAARRAIHKDTPDFRIEFDCPIMQAAYDLGPPESKIT